MGRYPPCLLSASPPPRASACREMADPTWPASASPRRQAWQVSEDTQEPLKVHEIPHVSCPGERPPFICTRSPLSPPHFLPLSPFERGHLPLPASMSSCVWTFKGICTTRHPGDPPPSGFTTERGDRPETRKAEASRNSSCVKHCNVFEILPLGR